MGGGCGRFDAVARASEGQEVAQRGHHGVLNAAVNPGRAVYCVLGCEEITDVRTLTGLSFR
jgi:hypothetical protein